MVVNGRPRGKDRAWVVLGQYGMLVLEPNLSLTLMSFGWSACVLEGPEDQPERVARGLVLTMLGETVDRGRVCAVLGRE